MKRRKRDTKSPRVVGIDIFCGAGAMSHGLELAGIKILCGIDNDPVVVRTYQKNIQRPVLCKDIRRVVASELRPLIPANAQLVLAVCAPCQPFSKVRKSKRRRPDRHLLLEVGRLVRSLRPAGLIVENVPQISRSDAKGVLGQFKRVLRSAGYSYAEEVLNAKHYGVPQTRGRLVLMALRGRDRTVQLPERQSATVATVRQAISRLPALRAGTRSNIHPLHVAAKLSSKNLQRIRATPANGGDWRDWPQSLRLRCHRDVGGFYDTYGRMRWNHPAPTLTTRCASLSNGRFGHPTQNRAITLLEAALLQTIPMWFRFEGGVADISRQIGNAVPVKLARALGLALVRQL